MWGTQVQRGLRLGAVITEHDLGAPSGGPGRCSGGPVVSQTTALPALIPRPCASKAAGSNRANRTKRKAVRSFGIQRAGRGPCQAAAEAGGAWVPQALSEVPPGPARQAVPVYRLGGPAGAGQLLGGERSSVFPQSGAVTHGAHTFHSRRLRQAWPRVKAAPELQPNRFRLWHPPRALPPPEPPA